MVSQRNEWEAFWCIYIYIVYIVEQEVIQTFIQRKIHITFSTYPKSQTPFWTIFFSFFFPFRQKVNGSNISADPIPNLHTKQYVLFSAMKFHSFRNNLIGFFFAFDHSFFSYFLFVNEKACSKVECILFCLSRNQERNLLILWQW